MEILYALIGLAVGLIFGWVIKLLISKGESGRLEERNKILQEENSQTENELTTERERSDDYKSKFIVKEKDYLHLQEKLEEHKKEVEQLQKKFTETFENLANRIFKEKTNEFSKQSKTNLQEILNPFKERIFEFQNKVEESNKDSISRTSALREQLQSLKDMNKQMSDDAQNLVKALKGDTKAQGDWGEIQLERILERSGLRKGEEYSIQESYTAEDGSRKRPDVIINLPEEKKIIIDSKVSLVDYERFVSAEDDDQKNIHLRSFIGSVKRHIKELNEKNYQSIFDQGSLDFVLMFIPIEPAFSLAVQFGEDLYSDAWDKRIMMVSPMNLFIALRTIANIWKQEYQSRNVLEIAKQSGALYDKFVGFVNDLIDVGNRMDQAKSSYEGAMKKLSDGSGNLVNRAEKIRELGAKTSKSLPQNIVERAKEE